jgi:hypothetical protein
VSPRGGADLRFAMSWVSTSVPLPEPAIPPGRPMRSPRALRAAERPATRSPGHQEGPDLRGPVVRQARQSASGERSGYPAAMKGGVGVYEAGRLLPPTSARQRARRRTIGFVLRATRGWRVLGRHNGRPARARAEPRRIAFVRSAGAARMLRREGERPRDSGPPLISGRACRRGA